MEFLPKAGLDHPETWGVRLAFRGENGWTSDGRSLLIWLAEYNYSDAWTGLLDLTGQFRLLPCEADEFGSCLSPDARYIVRGHDEDATEYHAWNWMHIDIIDLETEHVLWSLETAGPLQEDHWEWASDTRFAWSSGGWFDFRWQRPDWEATSAEVSVIDVTSGEIEVMDSADYLARFRPPPRATTDCPPNPAHACRILLDGEVVGEGRWPIIVGFIELD